MIPTSVVMVLAPLGTLALYGGVFALFKWGDKHGPCSLCDHQRGLFHGPDGCMAGAPDGSRCGCSGTIVVVRRA